MAIALLLQLQMASAAVSLFIIAIMLSTWYGGARPGLVSVLLANLALIYYFVTPLHTLAVAPAERPRVLLCVLATLSVAWLTATLRTTATSLGAARDELRRTVAELQSINRTLLEENAQRPRRACR